MVRYAIVRYTKKIITYADGEQLAEAIAKGFANHDYDNSVNDAWYEIEPDHVY